MATDTRAPGSSTISRPAPERGPAPFDTIAVVGLGYIGLPTAAIFAGRKIRVIGVDVNMNAVNAINGGEVHILEPELGEMVRSVVADGFLHATNSPEQADAFLIAVPTPFKTGSDGDGRQPDLSYIRAACLSIAPVLKPGDLVVLESTSPVGATEQMARWMAEARPDLSFPQQAGEASDIRVAHCPERVLPGDVLREFVRNDRVVGGMTPLCSRKAAALYKLAVEGDCIVTTARTAEMTKLTENSFRDVNIAFANELSVICDELGIDVWELIGLANRHPRVNVLQPGPGVGGHCIAVDPWFIVSRSPETARLIRAAREINDAKPGWVLDRVRKEMERQLTAKPGAARRDLTVACYGLAFKPDIDDLRESPALNIVRDLCDQHEGRILAVEPNIDTLPLSLARAEKADIASAIAEADIHVILVAHKQFRAIDRARWPRNVIDVVGLTGRA